MKGVADIIKNEVAEKICSLQVSILKVSDVLSSIRVASGTVCFGNKQANK